MKKGLAMALLLSAAIAAVTVISFRFFIGSDETLSRKTEFPRTTPARPSTPARAMQNSGAPVVAGARPRSQTQAPQPGPSTHGAAGRSLSPRPIETGTTAPQPWSSRAANDLPPGVPYASENDPVRIQSIRLSSDDVHGGDIASAQVITTSNAAALTARIGTYQVNVPRVAPGTFAISIKVPHLPVAEKTVNIVVNAIRSDGASAQEVVPIKVSY